MLLTQVIETLETERRTCEQNLERIKLALQALGRGRQRRRVMSAEARASISAAQRARWAEWHKAQRKVRAQRAA